MSEHDHRSRSWRIVMGGDDKEPLLTLLWVIAAYGALGLGTGILVRWVLTGKWLP